MKKIMFNDAYGLTDAVLQGRKTMTRRIARFNETERPCRKGRDKCLYCDHYDRENGCKWLLNYSPYKVGEVLAVAQAYKNIAENAYFTSQCAANEESVSEMKYEKGWSNKMYVAACYMPHQIRITEIKVERLQHISDEDCLREGIRRRLHTIPTNEGSIIKEWMPYILDRQKGTLIIYKTSIQAFAALIDKISGKGTWERNPYVFAYTFELLK